MVQYDIKNKTSIFFIVVIVKCNVKHFHLHVISALVTILLTVSNFPFRQAIQAV